jgi:hypothetical protein
LAWAVLIGVAYRWGRKVLGVLGVVACGGEALLVGVLALWHENAVLRRSPLATLRTWRRRLLARKCTAARRAPGRPSTGPAVKALILRIALDNPPLGPPARPGRARSGLWSTWQPPSLLRR